MKVMGIVGWSGSGKTSLLVELLPLLRARGLAVSTLKHTHHRFDVDTSGKDSYRHREAGATEVLLEGLGVPCLALNAPESIADFILGQTGLRIEA